MVMTYDVLIHKESTLKRISNWPLSFCYIFGKVFV